MHPISSSCLRSHHSMKPSVAQYISACRDMVPNPVVCWHDIVMWHECKCSSTQHLPWLTHRGQFSFLNTQYILFREILACSLQKADDISCLGLANLCPIPLPRLSEITRHKPRVTSWPVWCFGPGRDGPTCILSWIVTTCIYSSEHDMSQGRLTRWLLVYINVCHSVEFGLMAPVYSRDERAGEGRRGLGDLTHVHKFLMWEVKKVEGNSSLWYPMKRQAMGTNWNSGHSI